MTLFLLIAVVMVNFAANSVLSRAGIDGLGLDPLAFSGVRLAGGAAMLALIVGLRGRWPHADAGRAVSAVMLVVYLVPFSLAYLTLPAGAGALILFGVVQVTMFAGSAVAGVRPTAQQWGGMAVAMAGLCWLLWPTEALSLDPVGAAFMIVSGIGWGVFSLRGRGSRDPLGDMALSFILCLPVALILMAVGTGWSVPGVAVGILTGAVTSGLGYALWYQVLPRIAATTGAVAQLSVPVIALGAGALVLDEAITLDVVLASAVVLGGIAVSVVRRR